MSAISDHVSDPIAKPQAAPARVRPDDQFGPRGPGSPHDPQDAGEWNSLGDSHQPGEPAPSGDPRQPGGPRRARHGRRLWPWLLIAILLLGGAGTWYYWNHWRPAQIAKLAPVAAGGSVQSGPAPGASSATAGAPPAPPMGPPAPPRTPVVAVPAQIGDIPVVLDALGTVTPNQTVAVKSRVAGLLERVLFKEGDLVKEGQLLAEIDPRGLKVELAQAEGQLARDRALLENARVDLRRYETLFKQDSIARQQVDTQRALVRQYEGLIRVDESQVDSARLQLSYARVTAPITGRVGLRQVDAGNMVTGTETNGLVVITQVEPIAVVFAIPQDDLPKVMARMSAGHELAVRALDRSQQNLLATGTLVSVDNLIDPATGTIKLKAQFPNTDGQLFPNQFVNIRLELDTLHDAITVPSSAIQRGSQGLYVYVVKDDKTVALRPVTLGPVDGQRLTVASGIIPGELVVIDGVDRLREGAAVELIERPDFQAAPDQRRRRPPGPR